MPRKTTVAALVLAAAAGWLAWEKWGPAFGPTPDPAPLVEPFVPARIVVPERVAPYKLVRATIDGPSSNAYDVAISGDVDYATDDGDDRTIEFVGPPAVYTIDVVQVGATGDPAKPFRIARQKATVTIGEPPPPVPPTPPPPPPAPAFPNDKLGYSKAAWGWLPLVVDAEKPATAKVFGQQFAGVSSMISAGVLPNGAAVLAEAKKRNAQAAGAKRDAWLPFFTALKAKLDADGFDGSKPRAVSDYQQVMDELQAAMEAVK